MYATSSMARIKDDYDMDVHDFEDELQGMLIEQLNGAKAGMWISKDEIQKRVDSAVDSVVNILFPDVNKPAVPKRNPVAKPAAKKVAVKKPAPARKGVVKKSGSFY